MSYDQDKPARYRPPEHRTFEPNPANAQTPPLLLGFMGPPGGGKTKSALRVADGICRVRGGRPFAVDTEAGRILRYHVSKGGAHDFDFVQFTPPFVPAHFMDAIKQGVAAGAGCIIVDSMSDEHEGEGGVLDWHDREVPHMGGNEWAAWSKPKASRRVLISGIQQIRVPVILTFRAREKTVTKKVPGRNKEQPVNIGFQPIAPLEIVHTLDLTCLLPPRANGVPVWESPKEGEDFVIKLPEFLAPFITRGAPLDERLGEALARWQEGGSSAASSASNSGGKRSPEEMVDAYVAGVNACADLEALREYQQEPRRAAWVEKLKEAAPALHDRIIAANSRKAGELMAAQDEGGDDFPDDPEPARDEYLTDPEDDRGLFGGGDD